MSVLVQAQLRRGEHIGLIFVQCWEKTSLHSLGHRECHCRIAAGARRLRGVAASQPARRRRPAACEASHPSESDTRPLAAARHRGTISKVGVHIFVILICTSHSSFSFFYANTVTWTWIYSLRQRSKCATYFVSHTVLTNIHIFSASDLPRASYRDSKSLRLPDKLACPQKRWAEPGTAATDSEIVPLSGQWLWTVGVHFVVSVHQKSNVHIVIWSDSRAATRQESSSWQAKDISK